MVFGNGTDGIGPRRVTMEAIHDRSDIDGDDVPVVEHSRSRDAVHHLLIDRRTDTTGKPVVA
jgi:hypothetical protein